MPSMIESRKVTEVGSYHLERLQRLQEKIAAKIVVEDRFKIPIEKVTGLDVAYFNNEAVAAAVTMNYNDLRIVEERTMKRKVSFPYIPTYLSFREGPLVISLTKRLTSQPDVFMINSHGIAHPRFSGCASHVGVSINKPTIGVTRSKLCGNYEDNLQNVGDWAPLKYQSRIVGAAFLSKQGCKPIFISVGHMVTLETAIEIVKHFLISHKFPEPLRLAHQMAKKLKSKELPRH